MTRIKEELAKRGIIYTNRANDFYYRPEDNFNTVYIGTENGYILTVMYSDVLDPILYIHDKNYNEVGQQYLYPERYHFNLGCFKNRWGSAVR